MFIFTVYSRVFIVSAVLSAMVTWLAWRRRQAPGGRALAGMMGAVTLWQGIAVLESASTALSAKVFWSTWEYLASGLTVLGFVVFVRAYSGRSQPLGLGRRLLLLILPAFGLAAAASNALHGWIWTDIVAGPPGSNQVVYHHGPAFWILILGFHGYLLGGIWLLLHATRGAGRIARQQIQPVLLAAGLPWCASFLYMVGANPFPGLNLIPASFLPVGFLLLWGLVQRRLLDLVPVARDTVVDTISEGVLVAAADGCIVDINPAAEDLLGIRAGEWLGRPLSALLPEWTPPDGAPVADHQPREPQRELARNDRVLLVRPSRVRNPDHTVRGTVLVLLDVTDRRRADAEREGLIADLRRTLAEVKQLSGLLPICAACKKVRDDRGYWHEVEVYISEHSDATFTHGLCNHCLDKVYRDAGMSPDPDPVEPERP